MSSLIYRECEPRDIDGVVTLCSAHAAYEESPFEDEDHSKKLADAIFGCPKRLHCWVVQYENDIVGYVTFTIDFSTWRASRYLHLDCLYLLESIAVWGLERCLLKS
jgi:hypothetical protein